MKIISYNVNGIRAAMKKGFADWVNTYNPDIICLQEIKAMEDQIDVDVFNKMGYNNFWFSAKKRGYSGVAILTKKNPSNVVYGTGITSMDDEGRNIRVDFQNFSIMSLYLPSGTNQGRLDFKFNYMDRFYDYVSNLKNSFPNLIISGDYNICHKSIDIHDPVRNKNVSGFLPEEREWLDNFINLGFKDSFRLFNKEPNNYSWWSYRANARSNNKGWRIDYNLVSDSLVKNLEDSFILPNAFHSDHCPIGIKLKF
tara:strand:+ start:1001 stop:1762 length:762 start_codon:yes stop_codon:yes gene_type:complete